MMKNLSDLISQIEDERILRILGEIKEYGSWQSDDVLVLDQRSLGLALEGFKEDLEYYKDEYEQTGLTLYKCDIKRLESDISRLEKWKESAYLGVIKGNAPIRSISTAKECLEFFGEEGQRGDDAVRFYEAFFMEWASIKEMEEMHDCLRGYLIERKVPFLDNPSLKGNFYFLVNVCRPHAFKAVFVDLVNPLQRTVSVHFIQDAMAGERSYLVFKIGHPAGRYCKITIKDDADATKDKIYQCLDMLFAKASTWEEGKG